MAKKNVERAGLSRKIRIHVGEAAEVLQTLSGQYDFVYNDGWFMAEPAYLERMIEFMAPRATLAMANWFPLEDAVLGGPNNEWVGFDGPDWAERIQTYASTLAAHPPRFPT